MPDPATAYAIDRGHDCVVEHDARLDRTILWDRVRIGAGATLSHCVVADDVVVPDGASYSHCALVMRDNTVIADGFASRTISR